MKLKRIFLLMNDLYLEFMGYSLNPDNMLSSESPS